MSATAHLREAVERLPIRSAIRIEEAATSIDLQLPLRHLRRDIEYISQSLRTSLPLWGADQLTLATSLIFAAWASNFIHPTAQVDFLSLGLLLGAAFTAVGVTVGLYPGIGLSSAGELRLTTIASTMIYCVLMIAIRMQGTDQFPTMIALALCYAWCLLWLPIFRTLARRFVSRFSWWKQPALVFGGGEEALCAYRSLLQHPHLGLHPIELVDERWHTRTDGNLDANCPLSKLSDLHKVAESRHVFWGIVAMSRVTSDEGAAIIDHISSTVPNLLILPEFAKAGRSWVGAHDCGGSLGARCTEMLLLPLPRMIKRTMDLIFGSLIAVLLLPLMLAIAIAIKLTSPGSVFYQQTVLGLGGRRFCMWKFRSMHVNGHQILNQWFAKCPELQEEWNRHHKLRNDPRVTAIGRLLRSMSLDELPQLYNVIKGDMSLVGPRPYPLYECEEMQLKAPLVLRIRPGITGLWQVSGRSNMTFEQRLMIDIKYVRNWSVWIDLAILAKTVIVVLRKKGAY